MNWFITAVPYISASVAIVTTVRVLKTVAEIHNPVALTYAVAKLIVLAIALAIALRSLSEKEITLETRRSRFRLVYTIVLLSVLSDSTLLGMHD